MARFTTKELSKKTFPAFKRLFSQGNGWDHCGCTAYQGFRAPRHVRKWADKRDWNLEIKCDLVERKLAHGILVYAGAEPVGWCQFGPKDELPIRDAKREERPSSDERPEPAWKITCFVTHKEYRSEGIAGIALRAALKAIRGRGGGLVEAYPVARPRQDPATDERLARLKEWERKRAHLIGTHGRFSDEVERHLRSFDPLIEQVEGVGPVEASHRPEHCGTTAMFEREGFKAVAVLPVSKSVSVPMPRPTRVVMQRTV
jgi:ribosomal protein S18 acetylase RimI-like enzyme